MSTRLKITGPLFFASLTLLVMSAGTEARSETAAAQVSLTASEVRRNSLEGTWRVQITPRNCQTGAPLRPPFPAMASYGRGGILITSDSGFNPALRGAGHGVWSHSQGQSFDVVSEAFLFNPAGAMTGTQRLVQTLILKDNDLFEASVAAEVLDLGRNVISTGCATSSGVRMH